MYKGPAVGRSLVWGAGGGGLELRCCGWIVARKVEGRLRCGWAGGESDGGG